ncbi:cobalamin-dependent methylmalonyl-CoA mutase large subunit [Candidatus Symbiothrix dinenymphae]|nr:cobalamin-dependent methylmalonyl-CoA mutase large subunit [Candidatus Symbiothrix dinenymphae]
MSKYREKLFSEFPPVSTEKWMEKITADLKGADFEKKLVWKTNENFDVQPFYRKEDLAGLKAIDTVPGEFPYMRGSKKNNDWFVRQDIVVTSFAEANKKALDILNKGVNSLGFKIKGEEISREHIATLLKDILPECVELNFTTCNMQSAKLVEILVAYFKEKKYDLTKIHGSVNIDFVGIILRKGHVKEEWLKEMVAAVKAVAPEMYLFKVIGVNACLFKNAGSTITQELGYALAWGDELLSQLIKAGLEPALAAKKIKFNFGVSTNYFLEIAKFRAARLLWAEIVESYKPTCKHDCPNEGPNNQCRCASKMNIFAQTSTFKQTLYDAHVNLLRTQTEAMSASIAGVNSLLVNTFDEAYKTPDDFSERIARNQQLLLKEECHFDKVGDVSGGSYYIETLTDSIAKEAWKLFTDTKTKGFYKSVLAGEIQNAVNASADKRFKALAQRREVLLGTNQFPNFAEVAGKQIVADTTICGCQGSESGIPTLNTKRLGDEFETLRLTTEKSGKEVKAFMLTIGNLAMRLARSQFSSNFLACAGYKVIDNLGFETVAEGVAAARKAKADLIVLCSSDDEYATFAPEAHKLIGDKEILVIAGAPACSEDLKAQGITNYINVKSNVLETLQGFNAKLNIK